MLPVLYLDEHYVAVDKPSGLIVHRTAGCTGRAALQQVRDQLGARVYPVHRLDRSTSGVLLLARSPEAASRIGPAFMEGTIVKNYRAVVRGHPPMHGTIDSPLRDDAGETSRPAYTEYSRMAATEMPWPVGRYPTARYALVELVPRTGRTHQLRRHMAHVRHPIVGDVRHGDGRHNRAFREHLDLHRLMLFATRLTFVHPFTGGSIALQASLPPDATEALVRIGLVEGTLTAVDLPRR